MSDFIYQARLFAVVLRQNTAIRMNKPVLLLLLCCWVVPAFSQVGINGAYRGHNAPEWTNDVSLVGSGFSIGIDYWWRLKNQRIEFLPEFNVGRYRQHNDLNQRFAHSFYSLFLNTNFYLFDFKGDCDCPTFSKQGDLLKKGFFVQLSPGLSYVQYKLSFSEATSPDELIEASSEELVFSIGAAVGLDIGVTDLITITPLIGARYFPSLNWDELDMLPPVDDDALITQSPLWQWSVGARLGLRLDYGNKRRRW